MTTPEENTMRLERSQVAEQLERLESQSSFFAFEEGLWSFLEQRRAASTASALEVCLEDLLQRIKACGDSEVQSRCALQIERAVDIKVDTNVSF